MKELIGTARNLSLVQADGGLKAMIEVVCIVGRVRQPTTLRFVAGVEYLRLTAEILAQYADEAEALQRQYAPTEDGQ